MNKTIAISALVALGGCQQAPQPANNLEVPAPVAASVAATTTAPPAETTAPAQSAAPVDPKSAEAAAAVVQQYAALIEQKRFAEAEELWGDPAAAKAATAELGIYAKLDMEVGKSGDMEGAAGSSYVDVPVVLNGRLESSGIRHREGTAVLRRVNDVPGSTEAQRRWHIERIDWKF